MRRLTLSVICLLLLQVCYTQTGWKNMDAAYQPLPPSVHIYFRDQPLDTAPFRAFYIEADLSNPNLLFTTDTTNNRRLTPTEFYLKNNKPLVVVNGTFFSFATNKNLNVVVNKGKVLAYNSKQVKNLQDSTKTLPIYSSAIGISRQRSADVAWIRTDSSKRRAAALQFIYPPAAMPAHRKRFKKWKVQTAIGGGPVLVQDGQVRITNEEELMFAGKGFTDKHPRTAMGYTSDGKLIILLIEGRNTAASGATLTQEAQLLKDLNCIEALNLDGGGSSCLLLNGKETIAPSDKKQRAVPAVFQIAVKE